MKHLWRIIKRSQHKILKLDNVVGTGIGYKAVEGEDTNKLAVVVLVSKKKPPAELNNGQMVPRTVQGAETDVIEVGEFRFYNVRTEKMRPAQPGISIGHMAVTAGTFGAVVKDQATGELLILSNNHILANATDGRDGKSQKGDPILQPGFYDGGHLSKNTIAYLERFVPLERQVALATCPFAAAAVSTANIALKMVRPHYNLKLEKKSNLPNVVDAAVARPVDPGMVNPEILELGKVQGTAEAELGMEVVKSGRSSGVTRGKVVVVKASLQVYMGNNDICLFQDQVIAEMESKPGDSGSLVLDSGNRAVGLLFAGTERVTSFNRIHLVTEKLGITF